MHRRTVFAIALAIAIVGSLLPESAASPATKWSVVASPNPAGATTNNLDAVSCATATLCFAVGHSVSGPNTHAFIERWDGTRWSLMTIPSRARTKSSRLTAVSCPSSTFCFAVGSTESPASQSLVERWDGKHWAILNSNVFPTNPENWLNGVSCTSPTFCMAAGVTINSFGDEDDAFVVRWDGHRWTVSADQNPNGMANWLLAVSCVSPLSCMAVGEVNDNDPVLALVDHWNGKRWTITQLPSQSDMLLSSVACATATACVALGSNFESAVAERWGTGGWKPAPAPTTTAGGVVCTSATSCLEAGGTDIEHWNGGGWSKVSTTLGARLDGITCKGTLCVAVGTTETKTSEKTLVLQSR